MVRAGVGGRRSPHDTMVRVVTVQPILGRLGPIELESLAQRARTQRLQTGYYETELCLDAGVLDVQMCAGACGWRAGQAFV